MTRWLSWISDKKHKSLIPSTLITLVIVAMLIISGPAQAVQVNLTTTDLNNRPAGDTGSFFIDVIIGANERIPLTYVSVEGLPDIDGSPGGTLVFNVSDFGGVGDFKKKGNYNISLTEQYGWVGGYGYGNGYKNNNNNPPYAGYGYGYQFYGYGYGYGSDSPDAYTKLRYKITMDTAGAKAAEYNVIARVNAGNDVTGNNVAFEGSLKFTLISQHGAPNITGFSPLTETVKDNTGEKRIFSVTVNQTANVTWYINGTTVFKETNVKTSSYINNSASKGVWDITATATNTNGATTQKWDWIVTEPTKLKAEMKIKPETLNLASRGKFMASITSGKFDVKDIVVNTVEIEGAHAVKSKFIKKYGGLMMLHFNIQDLINIPLGNTVVLRATGKVNTGNGLVDFEASDTVRVINAGKDDCGKEDDDDDCANEDRDECEDDEGDCGEVHEDDNCNEIHEKDDCNEECEEQGNDIENEHTVNKAGSDSNIDITNNIRNNKGKIVIINNIYSNSYVEKSGEVQSGNDHEDLDEERMKENPGKGKKKGKD
ncbi:Uncharacterised protein [uncultured archaeon]|nr:Uncharacterised protein [uncultured archaeon]